MKGLERRLPFQEVEVEKGFRGVWKMGSGERRTGRTAASLLLYR